MPKYEDPIMLTKSKVFEYWKKRIFDLGFFIDWGEPSCWACGEFWNGSTTLQIQMHHTKKSLKFGRKYHFKDVTSFL